MSKAKMRVSALEEAIKERPQPTGKVHVEVYDPTTGLALSPRPSGKLAVLVRIPDNGRGDRKGHR